MHTKRLFILGAGFSAAAGMPTANQATERLVGNLEHYAGYSEVKAIQRTLSELADPGKPSGESVNFEKLVDGVRCVTQLAQAIEQADDGLSWVEGLVNDLQDIEGVCASQVVQLFAQTQASLGPDDMHPILSFAEALSEQDTVFSFNYDTLLETCLKRAGTGWTHGFPSERQSGVTVLKAHGSIDWALLPRVGQEESCRPGCVAQPEHWRLLSKATNYEWPEDCLVDLDKVLYWDLWRFNDLGGPVWEEQVLWGRRAIAGLGRMKPLSQLTGAGHIWKRVFDSLREADELYVIGYSFSDFDHHVGLYLHSALTTRKKAKPRILVVDRAASEELKQHISAVFGVPRQQIEVHEARVEGEDWRALLQRGPF